MKKLTFISCLLLSGCLAGAMAANKKQPIYKDAKAPIEERVNDLVSRMTLEEKVQQLNQYTLGRNNNENNRGEEVKKIPATLGSLIYFDEDANLRNEAQRKAMERITSGYPHPFRIRRHPRFRTIYPISLGQACSWNPHW